MPEILRKLKLPRTHTKSKTPTPTVAAIPAVLVKPLMTSDCLNPRRQVDKLTPVSKGQLSGQLRYFEAAQIDILHKHFS